MYCFRHPANVFFMLCLLDTFKMISRASYFYSLVLHTTDVAYRVKFALIVKKRREYQTRYSYAL